MSIKNGYCTLAEFKALLTPSGQTLSTDSTDDGVIEDIIERSSREFDGMMGRTFYPRVETQHFDLPEDEELWLDDDLLEVITLTNGDGTSVSADEYHFKPRRGYPKYALYLTDVTDTYWVEDSDNSEEEVIDLVALWGYREEYSTFAWKTGSTLNEATGLNATDVTFTVTSGTLFGANQIIRIDNELMIISSVNSNDLTVVQRGDNGSTAATHSNSTAVYIWQHPDDIVKFVLGMSHIEYKARFFPGTSTETTTYMTPGGIVTNPRALPLNAKEMINHYKRRV